MFNGVLGLYPRSLQTQMGGLGFCDRDTGPRLFVPFSLSPDNSDKEKKKDVGCLPIVYG